MDNNGYSPLVELSSIDDFANLLLKYYEKASEIIDLFGNINWQKVFDTFSNFSEKTKASAQIWSSYGWVPNLPEYNPIDLLENINAPKSRTEADDIMMNKIDDTAFCSLIDEITDYNTSVGLNSVTLKESVKCFENELYSACALLLFALIDARFLIDQPRPSKKRRDLACNAVSQVINKTKNYCPIIALTTKTIIKQLFLNADDFDYSKEKGLNRNFISHGMNTYNPNKTDCIKLFVLLYNIDLLFNADFFTWNKS